jgi:hypothetical protein
VANEHDSLGSVVIKLCENSKVPDDVAQALKFEKTLGLFHGEQAMTADTDHHLSDYGVLPLSSNTAPGRNKKQKALRMEAAILDIRKVMIQNPMAEYSPRTKISLMSRMSEKNRSTPFNALKNDDTQIKTLLKSGIGSMAHIEIPTSSAGVDIEMAAINLKLSTDDGKEGDGASLTRNDSFGSHK